MDSIDLQTFLASDHDDYIEYFLFPLVNNEEEATNLLKKMKEKTVELTGEYIWHRDTFDFEIMTKSQKEKIGVDDIMCFYGVTRFGDNIEDEWFIVYLLKRLTEEFPSLVVR